MSGNGPSRRRTIGRVVLLGLLAWLAAEKVISIIQPAPEVGHWRSRAGQQTYQAAYQLAMAELPAPNATLDVATAFGSVRVLRWDGPAAELPVLLLPGRSSGIPMWQDNLSGWIGERTIYAVDPIGDAGLSTQSVPLAEFEDQGHWLSQTIAGLGLTKVHLVGHSFGGANAAILAVTHPEQVATLAMIEPVFVIEPLPASAFFWATVTQLPVPQSWRDRALAEIGGVSVAEVRERTPLSSMIELGSQHYRAALPTPRTLSESEVAGLGMPVRLDVAGKSSLAGGQQAADRLQRLLPQAHTKVWPDTTHSLPMQATEPLNRELLAFWDQA